MKGTVHNEAERAMINYLLGSMAEAEQIRFEDSYFNDDAQFEQLQAVKQELVEAYVRGHLEPAERELFERNFLSTAEGRQQVVFAQTLRQILNENPASLPTPNTTAASDRHSNWWSGFTLWHWGWASIAACLLVALIWQGQQIRRLRQALSTAQAQQAEQSKFAQSLQNELQTLRANPKTPSNPPAPQPSVALPVKPKPLGESTLALGIPLPLLPGLRSPNDAPEVQLPGQGQALSLQIKLDYAPAARSCTAILRDAKGQIIARQSNLTAQRDPFGGRLIWSLPARKFKTGGYHVQVTGHDLDHGDKVTLNYYFRVAQR